MRVLSRKRIEAALAPTEPAVMAELALSPATAVVLADGDPPARRGSRRELLAAVRRYYPQTAVWHYRADATGGATISALDEAPSQSSQKEPAPSRPEPHKAVEARPDNDACDRDSDSEMISEEELRMLLDPTPAQASRSASEGDDR